MNEIINCLKTRRSTKKFDSRIVNDDLIKEIAECGSFAASGRNLQSPKIVVVKNIETIKKISKINASILGVDADPFYSAKSLIIVFADKNVSTYVEDGSLVLGNMMIAAHALGVGSCWIHRARESFETEEGKVLKETFGLSDNYVGIGNLILGYPENTSPALPRKEDYIIFDK